MARHHSAALCVEMDGERSTPQPLVTRKLELETMPVSPVAVKNMRLVASVSTQPPDGVYRDHGTLHALMRALGRQIIQSTRIQVAPHVKRDDTESMETQFHMPAISH